MKKIFRYGFPIFTGIMMIIFFYFGSRIFQSLLFGFLFWGAMDVAGRLNDNNL